MAWMDDPNAPEVGQQLVSKGALTDDLLKEIIQKRPDLTLDFVKNIIGQESSGRPDVEGPVTKSGERAQGLMGIMPATGAEVAQKLGIENPDLKDPRTNLEVGTQYLQDLKQKYGDDRLAAAAYNWGPGNLDKLIAKSGLSNPDDIVRILPSGNGNPLNDVQGYATKAAGSGSKQVFDPIPELPFRAVPEVPFDASQAAQPKQEVLSGRVNIPARGIAQAQPTPAPVPAPAPGLDSGLPSGESLKVNLPNSQSQVATGPAVPVQHGASGSWADPAPAAQAQPAVPQSSPIDEAYALRQNAAVEGAAAGIKKAAEEAAYTQETIKKSQEMQQQAVEAEKQRQEQMAAQQKRIDDAVGAYSNQKIDPNRLWSNMSTGNKILAAISVALGGLGAAMQKKGGDNYALQILMGAIDKDIEAQKSDISIARDKVSAERGILQDMRGKFSDEREAELAAKSALLAQSQLQLTALAAEYKGQEVQANAQNLYGQLEIEKQKTIAELNEKMAKSPMASLSLRSQVLAGKASPELLPEDDRARFVPGVGFASSKESATAVKTQMKAFASLEATLLKMKELRREYGREVFNRRAVGEGSTLATSALLQLKNLEEMGALDKGAERVGQRMVPENPLALDLTQEGLEGRIDTMLTHYREQFKTSLRSQLSEAVPEMGNKLVDVAGAFKPAR